MTILSLVCEETPILVTSVQPSAQIDILESMPSMILNVSITEHEYLAVKKKSKWDLRESFFSLWNCQVDLTCATRWWRDRLFRLLKGSDDVWQIILLNQFVPGLSQNGHIPVCFGAQMFTWVSRSKSLTEPRRFAWDGRQKEAWKSPGKSWFCPIVDGLFFFWWLLELEAIRSHFQGCETDAVPFISLRYK